MKYYHRISECGGQFRYERIKSECSGKPGQRASLLKPYQRLLVYCMLVSLYFGAR